MQAQNYTVISKESKSYLETLFDKYKDENDMIFFQEFKEIVYKSKLLEQDKVGKLVEQIGKEIREKISTTESQIKITKTEFLENLNYLLYESNKINNEEDPELHALFEILSGEEFTVSRSHLVQLIKEFELPITGEEFLSPIGIKENFSFSDFCYLFKNNENSDFLLTSITSGFCIIKEDKQENLFPIAINKLQRD